MPCAGIFTPCQTYHTFPENASSDLKTLMRYGFPQEIAEKVLDTRGMTNWEVLQPDCTALLFKKYWDWMNMNIASRRRRRGTEREMMEELDQLVGSANGKKKCIIL
ncbi:hypothetical protein TWF192_004672 [Orbilia oligospora]|uniref:Uncharacterized protein n=1 Tax=Orbilia oligospora TaxID=2813651 RepID=A0A6G1LR35_ORBOL|nr:hypothetical protein TWF191_006387 [Orbilia oligospora]KAF3230479.1 hypothetical protein TWF192_004672 [Orbilia oligospora]